MSKCVATSQCAAYAYSDRHACHRCGMAWLARDLHPGCMGGELDIPTVGQVLARAAYENPHRLVVAAKQGIDSLHNPA